MEIYKKKLWGGDLDIIFTGTHYYFNHSFHGLIAVAERNTDCYEYGYSRFELYVHKEFADEVASIAKRYINEIDQKYGDKVIDYEVILADMRTAGIEVIFHKPTK